MRQLHAAICTAAAVAIAVLCCRAAAGVIGPAAVYVALKSTVKSLRYDGRPPRAAGRRPWLARITRHPWLHGCSLDPRACVEALLVCAYRDAAACLWVAEAVSLTAPVVHAALSHQHDECGMLRTAALVASALDVEGRLATLPRRISSRAYWSQAVLRVRRAAATRRQSSPKARRTLHALNPSTPQQHGSWASLVYRMQAAAWVTSVACAIASAARTFADGGIGMAAVLAWIAVAPPRLPTPPTPTDSHER